MRHPLMHRVSARTYSTGPFALLAAVIMAACGQDANKEGAVQESSQQQAIVAPEPPPPTIEEVAFFGFGADKACYLVVGWRRTMGDTALTRRHCRQQVVAIHRDVLSGADVAIGGRLFGSAAWKKTIVALQDSTSIPYCTEESDAEVQRIAEPLAGAFRQLLADFPVPPDISVQSLVAMGLGRLCGHLNTAELRQLGSFATSPTGGRYLDAALRSGKAVIGRLGGVLPDDLQFDR